MPSALRPSTPLEAPRVGLLGRQGRASPSTLRESISRARSILRAARVGGGPRVLGRLLRLAGTQAKYRGLTMVSPRRVLLELLVANRVRHVPGCVVECGVWRGGMIAALAEVLGPARTYHLFDSFEGLPPASEVDGPEAARWQSRGAEHGNCAADRRFAEAAMRASGATRWRIHQGWFRDTVRAFEPEEPIALLRLDADWYHSTRICLESLAPRVAEGGAVVVDDYDAWPGCALAVDQYVEASRAWRAGRVFGRILVLTRVHPPG